MGEIKNNGRVNGHLIESWLWSFYSLILVKYKADLLDKDNEL